jgi:hypothetical protein
MAASRKKKPVTLTPTEFYKRLLAIQGWLMAAGFVPDARTNRDRYYGHDTGGKKICVMCEQRRVRVLRKERMTDAERAALDTRKNSRWNCIEDVPIEDVTVAGGKLQGLSYFGEHLPV